MALKRLLNQPGSGVTRTRGVTRLRLNNRPILRPVQPPPPPTTPTRLLIKYPTRQRPTLFKATFAKYHSLLSGKHPVKFIITMDSDDTSMNNSDIRNFLSKYNNVNYYYGESKSKVEAINADMEKASEFDILLLASDDMIPITQNYDNIIVEHMLQYFPNLYGCLHFNDGITGDKLNTLSIIGSKLYHHFGYIYHPDYKSLWCDNEFHDVTRRDNISKFINKTIIKHQWIGRHGADKLHHKNESFFDVDNGTYLKRKAVNFPKASIFNVPVDMAIDANNLL